jgi:ferredoxin
MAVTEVRIEADDCIGCEQCVTECDAVFEMADDKAIVKPDAQKPEVLAAASEEILNAANACPSEAIKYETA